LHWLGRHQTGVLLVLLVAGIWGALFVAYDYRSPVSQFLRGVGTVQLEGWSAYDLDTLCIRLEPAYVAPVTDAAGAMEVARKTYNGLYVRVAMLVSLHDTCNGSQPRLAWAVALAWAASSDAPALPAAGSPRRAIVLVDAVTGQLIVSHAQGQP
jgi:hypothetical protein